MSPRRASRRDFVSCKSDERLRLMQSERGRPSEERPPLLRYAAHLAHDEGYCGRRDPCCVNRDAQGYKFHSLPQREEGYEEVKPYVVAGDVVRVADSESDYCLLYTSDAADE